MSLPLNCLRNYGAGSHHAATDLVCYGLTFWEFRPLVERNGTIAWTLLQALAKQLRDAVSAKEKMVT